MSSLQDREVVVTGGTGALGAAVVAALLEAGASCHLPIVEDELPARLPWRTDARVRATPRVALDDEAAVTAYYAGLPALWASVHLVGGFAMKPLTETSLTELHAQWSLNAVTCFLCCREATRALRRAGRGGRLVNVTARAAVTHAPGMVAYTSAKAAVASMTQSLGAELVAEGILVNAVAPSLIDSPANRAAMPEADFSSWPTPAELARTICFLASPDNALTAGAIVPVYGRA